MKVFRFSQKISLEALRNFLTYLGSAGEATADLKISFADNCLKLETRQADLARLIEAYFSESDVFKLYCDGGSRGNPGPGACGFVIYNGNKLLTQGGEFFEHCTNNQAEYEGLRQGLQAALKHRIGQLSIYMDSQLIVKQVKGEYKVKHPSLLPLYQEVKAGLAELRHYEINFIPRRLNQEADSIVNQILDDNL